MVGILDYTVEVIDYRFVIICFVIFLLGLIVLFYGIKKNENVAKLAGGGFTAVGGFLTISSFLITIGAVKISLPIDSPITEDVNIENLELRADSVFEQGYYDIAITKYEEIFAFTKSKIISRKLENAKNCLKWKIIAEEYFKDKKYTKAKIEYKKIIDINPKDSYVKEQIKRIDYVEEPKEKPKVSVTLPQPQPQPIPLTGKLMIYAKSSYPIDIKIDGVDRGSLNNYFSKGKPDCGQDGTITVEVSIGKHEIEATCRDGNNTYSQTTTEKIKGGDCVTVPLDGYKIIENSIGKLVIYPITNFYSSIKIWIDGVYKGILDDVYFPGKPPHYGDYGAISEKVRVGEHEITTEYQGRTEKNKVNVTKNGLNYELVFR